MKEYNLSSWQDYWKVFDDLIESLGIENKSAVALQFQQAQSSVNGLTDGWYEFKFALEKALKINSQYMSEEQLNIAKFLLATLNKSLMNR